MLYEANPIAFLAEQAGGGASDGRQRILEKQPQSIRERTPLIVGSRDEVKRAPAFGGANSETHSHIKNRWKMKHSFILVTIISVLLFAKTTVLSQIELEPIGTYASGLFDMSASEIVAHDPRTQRIFVVNAAGGHVDVIDIKNPTQPARLSQIDVSAYGASANSVDVYEGVVAVAVEAEPAQSPGAVVFFDVDGNFLTAVAVGALPDMLTFTPNGRYVLVANEGQPNTYEEPGEANDPEGSVSVIDMLRGAANLTQADVRTADFRRFTAVNLDPEIRIFGPFASVAQDIEPEHIAVSDDSRRAWVVLQENNAIAVLDIPTATITEILPLGSKNYARDLALLRTFTFQNLPVLGTTTAGQEILLGGFSGLFFEGINPRNGNLQFITHPDRGPNADPVDTDGDGIKERPFPLPDYQAQWLRFELALDTGHLVITETIGLVHPDGTPITGLPNLEGQPGLAHADEIPIDLLGNVLERDFFGADLEGIVRADDGTYWMVDEYRPAIYHFSPTGVLINRFVPVGANAGGINVGVEAIPPIYAQRRANRGFEAVAYWDGILYAFIQSPIDNPDVPNDTSSKAGNSIRILAFDTGMQQSVGQYLYMLEGNGSDKIGDAIAVAEGAFLVIERDSRTGPNSQKKIFRIDIRNAMNIHGMNEDVPLESLTVRELLSRGITPVTKVLAVDLVEAGYDFADKPEGLALIGENILAIVNDNDFRLAGGFDLTTGLLDDNPDAQDAVLGIITTRSNGLDASNRDDAINIAHWPVRGLYQPDAIATFKSFGEMFLITANEGDARDYDHFSEEARVADLVLDPSVFGVELQADDQLGRLKTTTASGDADGDGEYETIFNYGARSFSIWTPDGQLVFDSGDDFERITAEHIPNDFNSTNDENDSFDARSDDKGPEPEGLAIGKIDGQIYAFIGLERVGGIMVYNVTDPYAPTFVQYINNRNFAGDAAAGTAGDLGPEGLLFISAINSPIGTPLLVVGNEVSGTTTIFQIRSDMEEDFSNIFFVSLQQGLNMISVPLKPKKPYTARSLMELLGATTVIGLEGGTQQFVGFTADAPDNGFPIEGGTGYIVNVPEQKSVRFAGAAWTNVPSVAAAPSPSEVEGAWAFVISGRFSDIGTDGYRVTVRNMRTNAVTSDFMRAGYFAAAFADLSRTSVVETGDRLEITVSDTLGTDVSGPDLYTVTPAAIEQAFLRVRLQQRVAPRANLLLQNYPNPFNPETWIPYQLSEAADVTITIYDAQGHIVRLLALGQKAAGFYHNRSRAAYWEGRNEHSEQVASGLYFYQIRVSDEAGYQTDEDIDFSAIRRMLVLK